MEKKKISLRGISEILSEKELKNVMGGSFGDSTGSWPGLCSSTCSGSCTMYSNGYTLSGTCVMSGPGPVYTCACEIVAD